MKVLKLLLLFAMGASLSLAGCDDDYLYPVEYPVYDPDGGSDYGGGDEIPVLEKVNNKVVAHRGGKGRQFLHVFLLRKMVFAVASMGDGNHFTRFNRIVNTSHAQDEKRSWI